jgi:MOSC domain-containing protein YiiM
MIENIFVAKQPGQTMQHVSEVEVVHGYGITGDRHYKKRKDSGKNITFIEREIIETYNLRYQQSITAGCLRRNVITHNVNLNALVGKHFAIGDAVFYGIELCEPCMKIGDYLSNQVMPKWKVVNTFLRKGGLRADVIKSGIISVGMAFEIQSKV